MIKPTACIWSQFADLKTRNAIRHIKKRSRKVNGFEPKPCVNGSESGTQSWLPSPSLASHVAVQSLEYLDLSLRYG